MYGTIRVKSVLHIGGVSTLQDMSLKAYAMTLLATIRREVQTLEIRLGVPAEYCFSCEAATTPTATQPGTFGRPGRTQLFWAVMAQDDIKLQRGTKSYAEVSIEESMAFLGEQRSSDLSDAAIREAVICSDIW
jgi:hypothetical protein